MNILRIINSSIRYKLIFGFVFVSLFVLVVGYIGFRTIGELDKSYETISTKTVPLIHYLDDMNFACLRLISSTTEYAFIQSASKNSPAEKPIEHEANLIQQSCNSCHEAFSKYEHLIQESFPETIGQPKEIIKGGELLHIVAEELIEMVKSGAPDTETLEKKEEFEVAEMEFLNSVDLAISHITEKLENEKADLDSQILSSYTSIIVFSGLTLFFGVLFGFLYSRSISNPVTKLTRQADNFRKGNLDAIVELKSSDEISVLGRSFNEMAERIRQLIFQLEVEVNNAKLAEEKLKMYGHLFKSVNDIINVADLNDDLVYVNPAFCKIYGYSEKELIGINSSIFWSDRNPQEVVEQIFPATLKGGWKGELFNKRKDGSEFPVFLSTSVVENDSGEQIAVVGIAEDITERKRLELERLVLYEITHGVSTTTKLSELLKLINEALKKVIYAENCFVALYDQKTKLFSFPYFVDKFDTTPEPVAMHKSCTTYVFRTGKPRLITPEIFKQLLEQNEVELVGSPSPSWIGVPLRTPARAIGVLVLQHYEEENIYSERDIQFLDSVGAQIAIVIERKLAEEALRESEEKLELFFSQSLDGFFFMMMDEPVRWDDTIDKEKTLDYVFAHQRITKINDAMLKQYLAERKQFIGFTPNDFFVHDIEQGRRDWRKFFDKGQLHVETDERRFDGTQMWVEGDYICLYDSEKRITGSFGIQRDVTERKRAELIIEQQNEKLQELNVTKDKFFSIIAHDLRSPFQGFLNMTELMSEKTDEFTTEELATYTSGMNKSAENLYTLLQNLLEWAQMQNGVMDFSPNDFILKKIVVANIEPLNESAKRKGITIINEVAEEQKVFGDERMINSIINNLLSNAVKFTKKDGTVVIKSKKIDDETVEISVQDTGMGMSESTINKLFKVGEDIGRKGTDGEPSTGLGLLLCKEFVEKHGGKIWAESKENIGSTFYFTL